ncbi:hypothetical protein FHL15_009649 [Xylaria flabelliformis]|uniref:TauD/TfdA-like domain-containing protein n=1 Tax=Xylaria flabelliformis TaxID=2512241 RepID=A0A553HNF2_9PEZI|nr:hypothetical protein FHL15_009649 [Xylaria flabelliformis]
MPIPSIVSPSLRLLPRNIYRASRYGLYIPRRQLSEDSNENGQPPPHTSQFDQFLELGAQPPGPPKRSGRTGRRLKSHRFKEYMQRNQKLSQPFEAIDEDENENGDEEPPHLFSRFEQYLEPDQSELSKASGVNDLPSRQHGEVSKVFQLAQQPVTPLGPSAPQPFNHFRRVHLGEYQKFAQPDTKVYTDGRYWKANLGSKNSFILYYRTRLAKPFTVSRSWLRDACTCEKCVNPSSGQKNYASADVPLDLDISHFAVTKEGELLIHWENDFHTHDTHVSKYPRALWDRLEVVETDTIPEPRIWGRQVMTETSPYYSYQSFMTDGPEYLQAMTALSELGLVFLRDIPSNEETVKDIASRLGLIQDTFYGTTWDVKSKPNAENVAYTNSYLGLHQDLLYMSNVPRIQILHCLENTCEGGESIFSDSYRAYHKFRRIYPSGEAPLIERKVVYHYNKGGNIYRSERPVLSDLGSNKIGVYWSPPFQSPVQADELTSEGMNLYKKWHKSARRIKMFLEEGEAVYEYKMKPGECVIFDNRRVLHGRRAFDTSSGKRWLKGTYVEHDSFNSRLRSLKLKPSEASSEISQELDS